MNVLFVVIFADMEMFYQSFVYILLRDPLKRRHKCITDK